MNVLVRILSFIMGLVALYATLLARQMDEGLISKGCLLSALCLFYYAFNLKFIGKWWDKHVQM